MRKQTRTILSAVCVFVLMIAALCGVSQAVGVNAASDATTLTSIQHRSKDNRLLLFLENSDYSSVSATTKAGNDVAAEGVTMLDNILLYLDDNFYVTLRTAWNNNGQSYYNVWGKTKSICLDTKAEYGLGKIKYLTVLDGCTFPSALSHTGAYAQNGTVTYRNNGYGGNSDCKDWSKLDTAKTGGSVAISVSQLQIRDNRLFFYFDGNAYADIAPNSDASAAFGKCNIMDSVLIWTSETESVPLSQAAKENGPKFYNLYTSGALALELGGNYTADKVKMVTIENGCQFPDNDGNPAFTQYGTITYLNGALEENGNALKWTVTDSPSAGLKTTAVVNVQVRDNKVFLFLSKQDFAQVEGNTVAKEHIQDALLEKIEIYTGETHASLKTARYAKGNAWYNHYNKSGCLAIQMDGETYKTDTVTKIVIKAGCEFPSALSGKSAYVTDTEVTFVSGGLDEKGQSTKWMYEPEEVFLKPTAAHIRGEMRENGTYNDKFMLYLDTRTDILNAPVNAPIGDKAAEYNFLDQILLWTTEDAEPITLRQAHTSVATYTKDETEKTELPSGELYYNLWGEQNCIAVQIGKYNADQITRICIPAGTEIPSYEYTSGNIVTIKKYVTAETIYLKDWNPTQENHAIFSTNWAADRNFGEVGATGVSFSNETIEISLSGTDYPVDGEKKIDNYFEGGLDCYEYITFDGVSLKDYIEVQESCEIDSWINATAYGTFAIRVDGLQTPHKIIIRKGCQLPIYANVASGVEIHDVFYFEVEESVMFVKQEDGSYKKSDNITWTVTFDGKDSVEVAEGGTVAVLPTVEKAGYRFVGWKLNGVAFTTATVINCDVDVKGEWVKVYTVTFNTDGGNGVESQIVDEEGYMTKPDDPEKEGYTFIGWVDGNGNEIDFNAAITADLTVVAKWEENKKVGCGGMVEFSSIGILALAFCGIIFLKKKKEN